MARTLGLGTVLGVDDDDSGTVFTTISLVVDFNPVPRARQRVDGTALADVLATDEMGIEDKSDFSFTHFCEPNSTNDAIMTTLFAAKTQVLWQVTYASADVEAFDGVVVSVGQRQVTKENLLLREVTVHRKAAIAYT